MGRERLERYRLTGPENQAAMAAGLAGGDWFRSAVPRKRMKELMRRSDYPAVRDTAIWMGLILTFAGLGITFWTIFHSWWAVPFLAAYGLLYGSTSDSRWHESGHGTASHYATDGHCSHEKTLLCDGLVMDSIIECPKHNGRFDYTSGKALGAPVLVAGRRARWRGRPGHPDGAAVTPDKEW